jgi:ribose 5-phosphate isomerase B
MDRDAIEALVRQTVERALGVNQKAIVDADMVQSWPEGTDLTIATNAIVTPLARQLALERKIGFVSADKTAMVSAEVEKTVAIGADHGGYPLKEQLKPVLQKLGYTVADCGTHSTDSVDYPDYAYAVARLVADGKAANGIVIDGAGIGSCMAANKVPGIRAALCYDQSTAVNSREHNHANVLTLGAGLIGFNLAAQIVTTWLATPFGPDRHARRVEKITQIEQRYTRS